jgi:hypothetical protein
MRFKKQNVIWVAMLLALSVVAVIGGAPPIAGALLLAATLAAAALAFLPAPQRVAQTLQSTAAASRTSRNMSPRAREAVSRASARGGRLSADMTLLDIGLITTTLTDNGLEMRRDEQVSKDDQGTRPFLVLKVERPEAERRARFRFDVLDPSGREQYVHEMDVYLREGEMNILPDTHLPLQDNTHLDGMGECTVRAFLDGELIAIDSFTLIPAYEERRSRLTGARRTYAMDDGEGRRSSAGGSVSLEDLLREQNHRRNTRE